MAGATALAAIAAVVAATMSVAVAEPVPVAQEGWAWFESRGSVAPPAAASGIEEGQLAVANAPTGAEKVSYLQLDLGSLGGSTPPAAVHVRLRIDPDGRNVAADRAEIVACLVTDRWQPAAPMAWDRRPPTDCEVSAPVTHDVGTAELVVDLTTIAAAWEPAYNFGFSLEPAGGAPAFQVVLVDAASGGVTAEAEGEAVPVASDVEPGPSPPAVASPPFDPGAAALPAAPIGGLPSLFPDQPPGPPAVVDQSAPVRRAPAGERSYSLRWPYAVVALAALVLPSARAGREILAQRRTDADLLAG